LTQQQPPPPSKDNDLRYGEEKGIMVPLKMMAPIAQMYMQFRPFAPLIMKVARVKYKIPPELDDAMEALAAGGDARALKKLAESRKEEMENVGPNVPNVYGLPGEVPPDEPGSPVMTDDMAEQAFYMHTQKRMGTLQIAQYFTDRGSPVSKATVARYIDDKRQDYQEMEEEQRQAFKRRVGMAFLTACAWFGSAVGLHFLLIFFRVW
jgi:hypothetical protein